MLRVLALDDSPEVLATLRDLFELPGVALTTCEEIEGARALLVTREFDACIADLQLRELGGLEGLRLIEFATTHFPAMAVFGHSGFVDEHVRAQGLQLGARAMFGKPEDLLALRAAVLALQPERGDDAPVTEHVGLLDAYLERAALHAHLQPIVSITEGPPFPVRAVESLARGPRDEPLGNPGLLFAYAAAKERLLDADLRCIEAGLEAARDLPPRLKLFLNVNPRSLTAPEFTPRLEAALAAAGRSPASVILELTEQQGILNTGAFAERLAELRFGGFRFALDDFGEGNSNLEVLRNLRTDYVKISGLFCAGLVSDEDTLEIVQAQVGMIRRLGRHSVMEFVETEAELQALRELEVDLVQGWHIARPGTWPDLQSSDRLRFDA